MGRQKKSRDLKVFEGNRSKVAPAAAHVALTTPEPPDDLHPDALAVWRLVVPPLIAAGRVAAEDRSALVQYCDAIRIERELARQLETDGYTVPTVQGGTMAHPIAIIRNRYMKEALALADRFGLNTKAREALAPGMPPVDEEDERLLGTG